VPTIHVLIANTYVHGSLHLLSACSAAVAIHLPGLYHKVLLLVLVFGIDTLSLIFLLLCS